MFSINDMRLRRVKKLVKKINAFSDTIKQLSNAELQEKTQEFKDRLEKGEKLDHILPEAYAVVRETSTRIIGLRHYDVQLMGGVVLHEGDIAEMRTGEGKTLVETLPAYLNALTGKGVHIITVNDYLAKRDKEKMSPIFEFLGLSVGLIQSEMNIAERKFNYNKDITYVTNNQLGFDYLKDNMAKTPDMKVLVRGLHYAIIDEVDSILIDEARTPLIISGLTEPQIENYVKCDQFVKTLQKGERIESEGSSVEKVMYKERAIETGDFIVDKKEKRVTLTEAGILKVEEHFNINYGDIENAELHHFIDQSLKANYLFEKDVDYIISNEGKIEIVDEFTGRVLKGRMYSDGLHQAIEAKEGVEIQPESKTLASITFQNLFKLYYKKSGMTGTGKTEDTELLEIYDMAVVVIPTNKPIKRIDYEDLIYMSLEEKYNAIITDIKESNKIGRPVLVGTANIEVSEHISKLLQREGIPHTVLNAKYHELEAEIISKAGEKGAVTVATNMAGRGTDIILSDEVKQLGGLKVIGTERHESRRIDDQLRGRSGRQGDPGESVFYLSLEDNLLSVFGLKSYMDMFKNLQTQQGEPISHRLLTNAVRKAQKNIEGMNYQSRKTVMEYDQVVNKQRDIIYGDRNKLFERDGIEEVLKILDSLIEKHITDIKAIEEITDKDIKEMSNEINELAGFKVNKDVIETLDATVISEYIKSKFLAKIAGCDADLVKGVIHHIILDIVDECWSEHIDVLSKLQKEIGMQCFYAKKEPMVEYTQQSSELFNILIETIQVDIVKQTLSTDFNLIQQQREEEIRRIHEQMDALQQKMQVNGQFVESEISGDFIVINPEQE